MLDSARNIATIVSATVAVLGLVIAVISLLRRDGRPPDSLRATAVSRTQALWTHSPESVLGAHFPEQAVLDLTMDAGSNMVSPSLAASDLGGAETAAWTSPVESIRDAYERFGGSLLVAGPPGSGKTTSLLRLAKDLLDEAADDPSSPFPVVARLSTWPQSRRRLWLLTRLRAKLGLPAPSRGRALRSWLARELDRQAVARPVSTKAWLDEGELILVLDGLDEVAPADRLLCLESINAFVADHSITKVVISSRTEEYLSLAETLHMRGAVEIQPLRRDQIVAAIAANPSLVPLTAALDRSPGLWELIDTPLIWAVAVATFRVDDEVAALEVLADLGAEPRDDRVNLLLRRYARHAIFRRMLNEGRPSDAEQVLDVLESVASAAKRVNAVSFTAERLLFSMASPFAIATAAMTCTAICVGGAMALAAEFGNSTFLAWILLAASSTYLGLRTRSRLGSRRAVHTAISLLAVASTVAAIISVLLESRMVTGVLTFAAVSCAAASWGVASVVGVTRAFAALLGSVPFNLPSICASARDAMVLRMDDAGSFSFWHLEIRDALVRE